jgi:hypothetical protein
MLPYSITTYKIMSIPAFTQLDSFHMDKYGEYTAKQQV